MKEKNRDVDQTWEERSAAWAKLAHETVSKDDAPNRLLIDAAGIVAGDNVLDLASGTGEPSISIALHVGEHGRVTATDLTAGMLESARQRAERLGLDNMRFEVCAMEALPFADDTFDVVTCRFGIMHSTEPLTALREARRVLKPGKRAAWLIHGPAAANTLWATVHTAAPDFLGVDDSKRVAHHFMFSEGDELADLLRAAGFEAVGEETLRRSEVRDADDAFWTPLLTRDYGKVIETLDEARKAALHAAMAAAFANCRTDGGYELLTSQRVVYGKAP